MTAFDYAVLVIVGLSILISLMRGAVREIFSVLGWVSAFYVAKTYALDVVPLLPADIPTDKLKLIAAFIVLFLSVLLIASLLSIALSSLIKKVGLDWFNRLLGGIFGLLRGLLIVSILVMLAGMTSLPKDERWVNAMFSAPLEALVVALMPWMPKRIADQVHFDDRVAMI